MRVPPALRDLAVAAVVIAGIVTLQATGPVVSGTRALSVGSNLLGELGTNASASAVFMPDSINGGSRYMAMDGAAGASIAVTEKGEVYTWGGNSGQRLGYPSAGERTPRNVSAAFGSPARSAAISSDHAIVSLADGRVFTWGSNAFGQLGRGGLAAPAQIALNQVTQVAAGTSFSLALNSQRDVFAWGLNTSGQVAAGGVPYLATPLNISAGLPEIVAIAAGDAHGLALDTSRRVWGWGANQSGQVGVGGATITAPVRLELLDNVMAIAAGANFSMALKADGTVWAWGAAPALGSRAAQDSGVPSAVLFEDGGTDVPLTGIVAIAAGSGFGIAVRADGRFVGWGDNSRGQLGFNGPAPVAKLAPATEQPVRWAAAGGLHTLLSVADPIVQGTVSTNTSAMCSVAQLPVTFTLEGFSTLGAGKTDMMLALDESGSLSGAEFDSLRQFAMDFVNVLDVGPAATRVGIVMFGTTSRLILPPSGSKSEILATLNSLPREGGDTCIGCGLNQSDQALDDHPRAGASRVIVVVTDGANNQPAPASTAAAHLAAAIAAAHAANTVVAVGVGDGVDVAELDAIASNVGGAQTMFTSPDFTSLDLLIDGLAASLPTPGSTNAVVELVLSSAWLLVSPPTTAAPGSTATVTGPERVTWTLPTLDHNGATLTMMVRPLVGGAQPLLASASFTDAQGNGADIGNTSVNITGCPASIQLSPVSSTGTINTLHTVTATARDHFGTPLPNIPLQIAVVSGQLGSLAQAPTNGAGQLTVSYSRPAPGIDVIEAWLASNPALRSNSAVQTWQGVNLKPIANAGPDLVVHRPASTIQLDGSASTDDGLPSGTLTYSWNGGPFGGPQVTVPLVQGENTFILRVFDGALTSDVDTVIIRLVDPTPPVVTPQVDGDLGENDWYTGNVSLAWTVEEPEALALTTLGCGPQSVTTDTAGVAFTCTATNDDAVETSVTVSIKRDATAPVVTTPASFTASATTAGGAVVTFADPSATDVMSGLAGSASCAPVSGSQFEIGATPVTCSATDAAGNVGTAVFTVTVEDTSAPEISGAEAGTLGANGWYISPVQLSWTVSDAQSAVTSAGCDDATVASDTTGQTFTCSATSQGGTTTKSVTIKRDATPPTLTTPGEVSASTTNAGGTGVTYAAPSASDGTSGVAGPVSCLPASGSNFAIGTTIVNCTAADQAGHSSSATFAVIVRLLDSTPPTIVPSVSGTLGSDGWYRSNVAVSFAVSDGDSAITSTGCGTVTVSSDTAGQTFTCAATSEGGAATQSVTVKRDATAPALTTPANVAAAATTNGGAVVNYPAASATDATSGVAGSPSCSPASGAAFPIGATTVNCTATDRAGNTASGAFTVTISAPGGGSDEPGRMHGHGHVIVGNDKVEFDFSVLESARGREFGQVEIHIKRGKRGKFDDDRFESRSVTGVAFDNAPDYRPGRNPKTGIDTVVFSGAGKWDRRSGYSYVVTASDRGEPGRGRDTFTIEVRAANGQVVFSGGGELTQGNVQSTRLRRHWSSGRGRDRD